MNLKVLSIIVAVMVGPTVSAAAINLNGVVKNKTGKPISGAIVTLVSQKISDTTDATGAYSIVQTTSANMAGTVPGAIREVTVNNGVITVSLPIAATVGVKIFDLKGKLLDNFPSVTARAGVYRLNPGLNHKTSEVLLVRLTIDGEIKTLRYLPMFNGIVGAERDIESRMGNMQLAKIAGTIDSLSVSKTGYLPDVKPVSSYTEKIDVTLDTNSLALFSFFVTSLKGLQDLSKKQEGFGGDLRFGKTGQGAGLLGADSICQCLAERSMPGSKVKQWRAFLSVSKGPDGKQVNAIDRIGNGPWYDRIGRVVSMTKADLQHARPNADDDIKDDLPNEDGIPNHRPDPTKATVDNHQIITGSDSLGRLYSATATCEDWTSAVKGSEPRCGLSWPRKTMPGLSKSTAMPGKMGNMQSWLSVWNLFGCEAGTDLTEASMKGTPGIYTIGNGGGYGGFYCFALTP